jgi:hypothetical protein
MARDTSLLEEEYRSEVLKYMHDMEAGVMFPKKVQLNLKLLYSNAPCRPLHVWISNLRLGGTCGLA